MFDRHQFLEKNGLILTVAILVTVAIGGLVEIAPLFYLESSHRKSEGRSALYASRTGWSKHLCA